MLTSNSARKVTYFGSSAHIHIKPTAASQEGMPDDMKGASPGLHDIMGGGPTASAKRSRTQYASQRRIILENFSPMERICLSANGNLQRIVSAYHDSPVSVSTRYNRRVTVPTSATRSTASTAAIACFERQVCLHVHGLIFAVCTSTVHILHEDMVKVVEERGVAIGQLFRLYNILPTFTLHDAGIVEGDEGPPTPRGPAQAADADPAFVAFNAVGDRFWREYTLAGEGVKCLIHEDIRSDTFSLRAPATEPSEGAAAFASAKVASGASFGDIMAPNTTFLRMPEGLTPMQRVLLTANGNVERLLSSYHHAPVNMIVTLNHRRGAPIFDRQVTMLVEGQQVMIAKTTAVITDPEWERVMDNERLSVGALFRRFNTLPTFKLHAAGVVAGGCWRQYELQASGLTCHIHETFDDGCIGGEGGEPGVGGREGAYGI